MRRRIVYAYMLPLGHAALGYFIGISISKITGEKVNFPLIFIFSLLPDIDILFPSILQHRSPTHSIVLAVLLFLPILILFKRGLPYFGALASHSLIGDIITNPPFQLFWPVSKEFFISPFLVWGEARFYLEIGLFSIMMYLLLKNLNIFNRGKIMRTSRYGN
jgi:membrane-bound metal-dependent hydrolase YbcI (DUF457 family)